VLIRCDASSSIIDLVNAIISFISLVISFVVLLYSIKTNRTACEIANRQRIDAVMPDIVITNIESKISLYSSRFSYMDISSICVGQSNPIDYILNNTSKISNRELVRKIKSKFVLNNCSSNSAVTSLEIIGIEKRKVIISGKDSIDVIFESEQNVPTIEIANSAIRGNQELIFKLQYTGVGTSSYDEITGRFLIPYQANHASTENIRISEYESEKKRVYRT
jgi:hypothetical protein